MLSSRSVRAEVLGYLFSPSTPGAPLASLIDLNIDEVLKVLQVHQ